MCCIRLVCILLENYKQQQMLTSFIEAQRFVLLFFSPTHDVQKGECSEAFLFWFHRYDLLDICINGPKEKLDSTVISQVLASPARIK